MVAEKRWAILVIADDSGKWCGNAMRYETEQEAKDAARDLEMRWMVVRMRWAQVVVGLGADVQTLRDQVADYLPHNYTAKVIATGLFIEGYDDHGWTLDGYVIPRLRSGLYVAIEIPEEEHTDA